MQLVNNLSIQCLAQRQNGTAATYLSVFKFVLLLETSGNSHEAVTVQCSSIAGVKSGRIEEVFTLLKLVTLNTPRSQISNM